MATENINAKETEDVVALCLAFATCLTSNNHDVNEKEARLRDVVLPGGRFDQMIDLLKRENQGILPMPVTKGDKTILDTMTILGGMVGQNGVTKITKRPEPDGTMAYKVMIGEETHNAFVVISLPPDPKIMGISNAMLQQVANSWVQQNLPQN